MKKIYLFSISLLALVGGAVAQTCPTVPGPIWKVSVSSPVPICYVIFNTNDVIDNNWYISLVDFDGNLVPEYGTGPGTSTPTPSNFVHVDPGTGTATFYYDCNRTTPPFVDVESINITHLEAGTQVIVCNKPVQAQIVTPVKLTSFNGRLQNDNSVSLDWTSVVEMESLKYEVERSADGKYFEKVGDLKAAGSSASAIRYAFNDDLPAAGAYFYRLKQIDFNGSFEYSKVVYINSKKGAGSITKVFPNPFQNTIQLVGATSSDLTPNNVQVMSISGQLMKYKVIGNAISIDPSAPNGLYIVKVKGQVFKLEKAPGKGSF